MCGRDKQVTFIQFSETTRFTVSRVCSCLLALVSRSTVVCHLETKMFQFPTATVLLSSLIRLMMYLGLCNKKEDAKPRICEFSKLAVSGAEGGAVAK